MANNIKGITVEIGGNTAPLDKALKDVNKSSRGLQSELKQVNRQLKLDPTNTTLLAQKQKLLAETISNTKNKLTTLKEAEKQAQIQFKQGKIGEEQYRALQREVIKTEQELKNFEKQVKSNNVSLAKISETANKVGESAGNVASKMAPATLAIGAAGGAAIKYASDTAESTNKVEVAFGDSSNKVKEFSNTTLDSFGIAKGSALDMASLFGDMATSMGLNTEEASQMSMKMVGLAGDLSSFKNIGLEEAETALNGVFTGETESLKRLGIVMTEQNLLQWAVSKGMIKNKEDALALQKTTIEREKGQKTLNDAVKKYGENSIQTREAKLKLAEIDEKANKSAKASLDTLTQSEKVQLRYNYVMDMTKNAQGDFARTSDGTANSSRVLKESIKELASEFGEMLLPIITPIIQKITQIIKHFASLDAGTKKIMIVILGLVAAIAPIASLISGICTIVGVVTGVIGAITGAIGLLNGTMTTATVGAKVLAAAIKFITGPIGITIGIISLLVGALVYLFNHNKSFHDFVINAWSKIKEVIGNSIKGIITFFVNMGTALVNLKNNVSQAWNAIKEKIVSVSIAIGTGIKNTFNKLKQDITNILNAIKSVFTVVWNAIKAVTLAIITPIVTGAIKLFNNMKTGVITIFNGLSAILGGIWNVIKLVILGPVLLICDLVTGNFTKLKTDAQKIFTHLQQAFITIWNGIKQVFWGTLQLIAGFWGTIWNGLANTAKNIFNNLSNFLSNIWENIKSSAIQSWINLKEAVVNLCGSIKEGIINIWNGILNFFSNLPGKLYNAGVNMFTYMKNGVVNTIGGVKEAIVNGINNAIDFITALPSRAYTWGTDFIEGLIKGIKGSIGAVGDAVAGVANKITSFLHFSVPDEGPLTEYETWMPDFMMGLANGIENSKFLVKDAVKNLATDIKINFKSVGDNGIAVDKPSTSHGVVNNIYLTQNIQSLKGTPSEVARQTKNNLRLLGLKL